MGKQIIHGLKGREAIIKGINILADTVKVTLGPRGRNVAIAQVFGPPRLTKDGVTVAKAIKLDVPDEQVGIELVQTVAAKTAEVAGDGTTTATVLAQAIVTEGNKAVSSGANPMDVKRGIDLAVSHVIKEIKSKSKSINTHEEITQVGTISSNGDKEIGSKIAEAVQKVGKEGVITVEESKFFNFDVDIVEGMRFDKGYISPYFVTNPEKMIAELEEPIVLIFDKKLAALKPVMELFQKIAETGRPLLIIAEDVEGEVLATLIINKMKANTKWVAVKSPSFGNYKRPILDDIAMLCGNHVIGEDQGVKLESVDFNWVGTIKKAIITKDHTTLIGSSTADDVIEARRASIRNLIEVSKNEQEKNILKERLAKLTGGVAVLKVGGATEVDIKECKDRVEDALHATRAAIAEGVSPGGGTSFFYAAKKLESLKVDNEDQQIGINIIRKALEVPLRQICENAGVEGAIVVGELNRKMKESVKLYDQYVEHGGSGGSDYNYSDAALVAMDFWRVGFDAQGLDYVDMLDKGIVDPTKVLHTALKDASTIASLIITTEAIIVNKPIDPKKGDIPQTFLT